MKLLNPGRSSDKIRINCFVMFHLGTFPEIRLPHEETNAISPRVSLAPPNKVGAAGSSVASASFRDLQETAVRTPALARLLQGHAFLTASGHVSKLGSKGERVREGTSLC